MDIVFGFFVDLYVITFAVGWRSRLKHISIDLVDFFLKLADSIVNGFLLFNFGFLGWESLMIY
jgi:hypothetical protein